jgi:hypothetical protein
MTPAVVGAEYRGDFRIRLAFSDGVVRTIDFSDWLEGPVFEPLEDPAYFAGFFIDGGTIAWPNGADIAPETLHDRASASEAAVAELTPAPIGGRLGDRAREELGESGERDRRRHSASSHRS